MRFLLALTLLLLTACSADVDRTEWQQMTAQDRLLYVNSLLGAEKVKEAKGGNDRVYSRPPEEYVRRIDEAYAKGDARKPEEIFGGLGERKGE